ncbi:MAG: hypothetical protein IPO05_08265 [Flavobacteriales bacterium]|nr:hypothetical protein [Flavobacteriales bacterium]MBK9513609.1 hypothetical protein [Flavobacteriales bacterium]HOZ39719.1 hypothetical protein [Flavobacteriales bacterium]
MRYYFISLSLAAALPSVVLGQGQQGSGSPYSAYGFGELLGSTQVVRASMGGVGIATYDPYGLDPSNPASYTGLIRPVFEAGIAMRTMRFEGASLSTKGNRTDLLGLSLGIPFKAGRWAVGFGLSPYSDVGYRITSAAPLSTGEGDVRYIYTGDGGLNKAFFGLAHAWESKRDSLGNGWRVSAGANYNHLFGQLVESRQAIYPVGGFYNSNASNRLFLRDGVISLGTQVQSDLVKRVVRSDEGLRFMVGVTVELGTSLRADRTQVVNSFSYSASGVELPFDTVQYLNEVAARVELPVAFGLGFGVSNAHWSLSMEHRMRDWTKLVADEASGARVNDLGVQRTTSLGGSFRPAGDVGGNFWERTIYRLGFRYMEDYLVVKNTQLDEIGMSFGMSLPVMGSSTRSRLNIGAELGERGSLENGLLRERFADVYIGISITPDLREQWFKKRRIE